MLLENKNAVIYEDGKRDRQDREPEITGYL